MKISGASVVEVVKLASANVMNRNADAKMQIANKRFLISHHLPRTHADYKCGHFPATDGAECRLNPSSRPLPYPFLQIPAL